MLPPLLGIYLKFLAVLDYSYSKYKKAAIRIAMMLTKVRAYGNNVCDEFSCM